MDTSQLELLRADEVARLVGLSTQSIRAAVAEGTFPRPVRVGARGIAWKRSCLEAWIAALPTAESAEEDPFA